VWKLQVIDSYVFAATAPAGNILKTRPSKIGAKQRALGGMTAQSAFEKLSDVAAHAGIC